jgi:hypothetical protein
MEKTKTPEHLLQNQLAACLDAMQDCLAHSRAEKANDPYGHQRHADLDYVAKLMKASARLSTALARLNGDNRLAIHVTHEGKRPAGKRDEDKGEG